MRKFVLIFAILIFIVVNILLVLPARDLPNLSFLGNLTDKFEHATVYFLMVILFSSYFVSQNHKNKKLYFFISLTAALHGVLMEFVQEKYTDRAFDYGDMIANALGAFLAFWVSVKILPAILKWYRKIKEKNKPL